MFRWIVRFIGLKVVLVYLDVDLNFICQTFKLTFGDSWQRILLSLEGVLE